MDGHGLILMNWLSHSVGRAMPTLLLIWSSYSMEPSFHPSRFLTKLAVNTITIADRAHMSVTKEFDGLLVTFGDGDDDKDLKQNGTGMTTGAVLAFSAGC
jgi:protein involved in ribonucleotide reduction